MLAQIDELPKNYGEKKTLGNDFMEEKVIESEKRNRQTEYRDFLLKQIEDKEKCKRSQNSPKIHGNAYTYSEDLMTPEV